MARVTDPSFKFWYSDDWYTVQGAETMYRTGTKDDIRTMRAEYTRMRDVAQKRIKRLGEKFPESKTYQQRSAGFKKLKDINPDDFAKAFSDLAKFVHGKLSTVTGQRAAQEKTINTLNKAIGASQEAEEDDEDSGYQAGVNKKNYWRVIKILDAARKNKIIYGSDIMVTLAESTLELSDAQFDVVLENLDKFLGNVNEVKGNLEDYMQRLNVKDYQKVNMDDFITQIGW